METVRQIVHPVIFGFFGSYNNTPADPIDLLVGETDTCWAGVMGEYNKGDIWQGYANSDSHFPVDKSKYFVGELTLPEGISFKEYIENRFTYRYLWKMVKDSRELIPGHVQYEIANMIIDFNEKVALFELGTKILSGKGRSDFRKSLWEQVMNWVNSPTENRKFRSPLSPRQMSSILRPAWQYKKEADRIYYNFA